MPVDPSLEALAHLLPDACYANTLDETARHLFLVNISILLPTHINVSPSTVRLVRCKYRHAPHLMSSAASISSFTGNSKKDKEPQPQDAWYAALVAVAPERPSGLRVLVKGPPWVGEGDMCRINCIRGLRDEVEKAVHKMMEKARREEESGEMILPPPPQYVPSTENVPKREKQRG